MTNMIQSSTPSPVKAPSPARLLANRLLFLLVGLVLVAFTILELLWVKLAGKRRPGRGLLRLVPRGFWRLLRLPAFRLAFRAGLCVVLAALIFWLFNYWGD